MKNTHPAEGSSSAERSALAAALAPEPAVSSGASPLLVHLTNAAGEHRAFGSKASVSVVWKKVEQSDLLYFTAVS